MLNYVALVAFRALCTVCLYVCFFLCSSSLWVSLCLVVVVVVVLERRGTFVCFCASGFVCGFEQRPSAAPNAISTDHPTVLDGWELCLCCVRSRCIVTSTTYNNSIITVGGIVRSTPLLRSTDRRVSIDLTNRNSNRISALFFCLLTCLFLLSFSVRLYTVYCFYIVRLPKLCRARMRVHLWSSSRMCAFRFYCVFHRCRAVCGFFVARIGCALSVRLFLWVWVFVRVCEKHLLRSPPKTRKCAEQILYPGIRHKRIQIHIASNQRRVSLDHRHQHQASIIINFIIVCRIHRNNNTTRPTTTTKTAPCCRFNRSRRPVWIWWIEEIERKYLCVPVSVS